jgi:hypothetical protein
MSLKVVDTCVNGHRISAVWDLGRRDSCVVCNRDSTQRTYARRIAGKKLLGSSPFDSDERLARPDYAPVDRRTKSGRALRGAS